MVQFVNYFVFIFKMRSNFFIIIFNFFENHSFIISNINTLKTPKCLHAFSEF